MYLDIRTLNNSHPKKIRLRPTDTVSISNALPYFLETDALEIDLYSPEEILSPRLIINSTEMEFNSTFESGDGKICYKLTPKRTFQKGYESLFFNYFGVVSLSVEYTFDEKQYIQTFEPFEILARKYTAEQAEAMITYIFKDGDKNIHDVLGATYLGSKQSEFGEKPGHLLKFLNKTLDEVQVILPNILRRPISRVSAELSIVSGDEVIELTDQSAAWLSENLGVLSETDNPETAHIVEEGSLYSANILLSPVLIEDLNVYENKVLHGFMRHILAVARELYAGIKSIDFPNKINSHNGYESFFKAMSTWVTATPAGHLQSVKLCVERAEKILLLLNRYLPVQGYITRIPHATPKVRSNRHYLHIFKVSTDWYKKNKIDWREKEILNAIQSMPDLFESYVTSVVGRSLANISKDNGYKGIPFGEKVNAVYSTKYMGFDLSLFKEPHYYMPGHVNDHYKIYNNEAKTLPYALNDAPFKKRHGQYQRRSPDIVIEVSDKMNKKVLIVLDAKYTSPINAFERDLSQCIKKYVNGLSDIEGNQIVKSLIILHPEQEKTKGTWLDSKLWPFNVEGAKPALPYSGTLSVPATDKRCEKIESMLTTIISNLVNENLLIGEKKHFDGLDSRRDLNEFEIIADYTLN